MDARSGTDAASTIAALKASVISELRLADTSVEVKTTDYFNHSFVPDMVLRWGGRKAERAVYLRTSSDDAYLLEDLALVQERQPLLVPLTEAEARFEGPRTKSASTLAERARSVDALVANRGALNALAREATDAPIAELASAAFLRGASGVVDAPAATAFASAVKQGFVGVRAGDAEATSVALSESRQLLAGPEAEELADLFQAVWVGGGQAASEFPGQVSGSSTLDSSALRLLLDAVDIEDVEFWSRVARNVDIASLAGLELAAANLNFQRLMIAVASRLTVKAARVVAVDAEQQELMWAVSGGVLTAASGQLRVQFAPNTLEDFSLDGVDVTVSVPDFERRAANASIHVSGITLRAGERRLEYASEDGTSINGDRALESVGLSLGDTAQVIRAEVRADGRDLHFNLESATAYGNTRSKYPLSAVLEVAAGLSVQMDAKNLSEVQSIRTASVEPDVELSDGPDAV